VDPSRRSKRKQDFLQRQRSRNCDDSRNGNVGLQSLPNLLHTRISSRLCPINLQFPLRPLFSNRHLSFISLPAFSLQSCNLLTSRPLSLPSSTRCRHRTGNSPPISGLLEQFLPIPPGQSRWISLPLASLIETSANPDLCLPSIHSLPTRALAKTSSVRWDFLLTLVIEVLAPSAMVEKTVSLFMRIE